MATHYETLGIGTNAEEGEIKRAWARLVRQHPPDQDPEGNRRLNEAKTVLLDPQARADYDAQLNFGDDLTALFDQAYEATVEEEYAEASSLFKEILALHPGSLEARNQLGLTLAYQDLYPQSEAQFLKLVEMSPDSALYAANLGQVYRMWGRVDEKKLDKSEEWLLKATSLESFNSQHHLALSRLYLDKEEYQKAEQAIEDAIGADGKIDSSDIDAMMGLTWVYLLSGQKDKIAGVASRVQSVLPDDEESQHYAAYLFLRTAADLVDDYQAYQDAGLFIAAARTIRSDFGEYQEAVESLERSINIDREAKEMQKDMSIHPPAVPKLLSTFAFKRLGYPVPDEIIAELMEATNTWPKYQRDGAAWKCIQKYPYVTVFIIDFMSARFDPQQHGGQTEVFSKKGCLVLSVGLAVLAIFLAIVYYTSGNG